MRVHVHTCTGFSEGQAPQGRAAMLLSMDIPRSPQQLEHYQYMSD